MGGNQPTGTDGPKPTEAKNNVGVLRHSPTDSVLYSFRAAVDSQDNSKPNSSNRPINTSASMNVNQSEGTSDMPSAKDTGSKEHAAGMLSAVSACKLACGNLFVTSGVLPDGKTAGVGSSRAVGSWKNIQV